MPAPELIGLLAFLVGPALCLSVWLSMIMRRARRQEQETARASAWEKMDAFYAQGGPNRTYLA